jgi:hypothetical protein
MRNQEFFFRCKREDDFVIYPKKILSKLLREICKAISQSASVEAFGALKFEEKSEVKKYIKTN